jgi:hypothetical protein
MRNVRKWDLYHWDAEFFKGVQIGCLFLTDDEARQAVDDAMVYAYLPDGAVLDIVDESGEYP